MSVTPPFMIVAEDDVALEALDAICTPINAERILTGAYLSVLRAWDKDAKREPFCEMLENCTKLFDLMARIKFLTAAQIMLQKGPLDPADLAKSLAVMTIQAESLRTKQLELMKQVHNIPPRGVSKH